MLVEVDNWKKESPGGQVKRAAARKDTEPAVSR